MKFKVISLLLAFASTAFSAHAINTNAEKERIVNEAMPTQTFDQGYEVSEYNLMGAYNAPARIDVKNCWDLWIDASFLYWKPLQEGMLLGKEEVINPAGANLYNKAIFFDFDWDPGFKLGLGLNMGHDNWQIFTEYLRYHNSSSLSKSFGTDTLFVGSFFVPHSGAESFKAKWKLSMDLWDLSIARPFYNGTRLIINPFLGLRAAWIDQKFSSSFNVANFAENPFNTKLKSKSFGIGPRFGSNGSWILGKGFKLLGNAAFSLLHTHYKLNYLHDAYYELAKHPRANVKDSFNYLRPALETEIALAWGSYFDCDNWHFDLVFGYDFNIYWNQNVFHILGDRSLSVSTDVAGGYDLYHHGLVLKMKLDF